jgi:hypothetical protein
MEEEQISEEFAKIVESYQVAPTARPRSKYRALAVERARKRAERAIVWRERRCKLTFPFGHHYEMRKDGTGYSRGHCVWCDKLETTNYSDMSAAFWTIIVLVAICGVFAMMLVMR